MSLVVTTNRHWREVTHWQELTPDEQAYHDYADESDLFVRYRGMVEWLGSFMRLPLTGDLSRLGWDGACADGMWSGWLIRVSREGDTFQIGAYREVS